METVKEVRLLSEFGSRIKQFRQDQGISAEELSRRSGVNMKTIYQIEHSDQENPRIDTIQRIADGLGVSLTDLLSNSESRSAS